MIIQMTTSRTTDERPLAECNVIVGVLTVAFVSLTCAQSTVGAFSG
jgi:hypothetical protein